MIDNKILYACSMNGGEGYCLQKKPDLKYTRFGDEIIGSDGLFCTGYYYDKSSRAFEAFGGREFTLTMSDGEVIECNGQWWHGNKKTFRDVIGETVHIAANDIKSLQNCYVYNSYDAIVSGLKELRDQYTGGVYAYYDLEKVIKYDQERSKLWGDIFKLRKAKKHLITRVKGYHEILFQEKLCKMKH